MTRSTIQQLDDEFVQNPYPVYERLRAQGPVSRVTMPGGHPVWVITRYAEARAALADPRLVKDWRKLFPGSAAGPDDGFPALDTHMLSTDPPDHDRLRRLVSKAFTARRIEQLRPRVTEITASLLDDMPAGGQVDLLEAFAFPLPITVICELLGVPDADRDDFRTWTRAILSPGDTSHGPRAAATSMAGYFTALVADKRAHPADDLLSALIAARDEGDRLSERELLGMIFLLLVAGHETTVNLIGSGTLALLLSPGEMARLRADRSLLPGALEELLRYTSPVNHATFRFTAQPVEVGGTLIPAREPVLIAIGSANHDPGRYPAPDRLDVGRDAGGNLAFGHGIHYCLGAPLARMEGEIAFGGLLSRFPGMTLAVPPESLRWRPSTLIHGLETLPVRLSLRLPPRSNGRRRPD
jgi:cytochrome P450